MGKNPYWKKITDSCIASGMCIRCRKRKAERNRRKCKSCNEYQSAYIKRRRESWRSKGLCIRCGAQKDDPTLTDCINCHEEKNRDRLIRKSL